MNNLDLIEADSPHAGARGGTELIRERLYDGTVPRELLQQVQILFSHARELDPARRHVFYAHNPAEGAESYRLTEEAYRAQFDRIVFVSHWQMQEYNAKRRVPYQQSAVIKNSIVPLDVSQRTQSRTVRIIYHTMPDRGLALLVPVFIELARQFPDVELHVYSSFGLYGWDQHDALFQSVYDACRQHPKIVYHGVVPNQEIRAALLSSDIFAYPALVRETSSLCLMEAMSAGLVCIHPNIGALPETALGQTWMYQWREDPNAHASAFYALLLHACQMVRDQRAALEPGLRLQKLLVDRAHNWRDRAAEWTALLTEIVATPRPT